MAERVAGVFVQWFSGNGFTFVCERGEQAALALDVVFLGCVFTCSGLRGAVQRAGRLKWQGTVR